MCTLHLSSLIPVQATRPVRPALPKTMRDRPQGPSQADVNGRLHQLREGNELEQEAAQALDSQEFRPRSQSVLQPGPRWGLGSGVWGLGSGVQGSALIPT